MRTLPLIALLVALCCFLPAPAHAEVLTPAHAIGINMTFVAGNASMLVDGNVKSEVFVNPFLIDSYIDFIFSELIEASSIRIYNDYDVNDASLVEFNLEFYNGPNLIATQSALASPLTVALHTIPFTKTVGPFNTVRLTPVVGQGGNRFQMREVQFNGNATTSPARHSTWGAVKALFE